MRKTIAILLAILILGCAKVSLETRKPIKVDVTMRIDVYQHVQKEAASIEDQIYGSQEKQLNYIFMLEQAYAAEGDNLSLAIERRKARASLIESNFSQGYIGEDKNAYLKIMPSVTAELKIQITPLLDEENKDREIIYQATAKKNNADILETKKIFYQDHYNRAKNSYWFEVYDEASGSYSWKQK